MLRLSDFPAPPDSGGITVCEYDCHLITSGDSEALLPLPTDLQKFPSLKIPNDLLRLCESKENCAKSAFLAGTVTVYGKLSTAW